MLGFLCGGETWTRVAGPIPSSPANSMAKGAPKTTGALPRTAAPATDGRRAEDHRVRQPGCPKRGQKQATAAQPADPVGDICLLPDIARFAH